MSTADGTTTPPGPAAPEPSPRRRRRRWPLVAAAVAVVVATAGAWVAFGGERARPSSEDEARRRLGGAAGAGTSAPAAPAGAVLAAAPATGLYRYRGGGQEYTSTPPLTEELGPSMPATVLPRWDGCWVLRIDYNTHHWDDTTYCTGGGRLVERGGSTFTRRVLGTFDIDNLSTFTCDPNPLWQQGDLPGTRRPRRCTGAGSYVTEPTVATGTVTVIGPERLDVAGEQVATMHLRYDVTVSQAQTGTETTDLWFTLDTGLPVRNQRRVEVTSSSPIGDIRYTEEGWQELTALRPV